METNGSALPATGVPIKCFFKKYTKQIFLLMYRLCLIYLYKYMYVYLSFHVFCLICVENANYRQFCSYIGMYVKFDF